MSGDKLIPDDVMRGAADFCRARGVSPMDIPFHPTPAVLAVIDGIMAERERAAKVADDYATDHKAYSGLPLAGRAIATAIRNGA